jgi:hypothetical protein
MARSCLSMPFLRAPELLGDRPCIAPFQPQRDGNSTPEDTATKMKGQDPPLAEADIQSIPVEIRLERQTKGLLNQAGQVSNPFKMVSKNEPRCAIALRFPVVWSKPSSGIRSQTGHEPACGLKVESERGNQEGEPHTTYVTHTKLKSPLSCRSEDPVLERLQQAWGSCQHPARAGRLFCPHHQCPRRGTA